MGLSVVLTWSFIVLPSHLVCMRSLSHQGQAEVLLLHEKCKKLVPDYLPISEAPCPYYIYAVINILSPMPGSPTRTAGHEVLTISYLLAPDLKFRAVLDTLGKPDPGLFEVGAENQLIFGPVYRAAAPGFELASTGGAQDYHHMLPM